MVLVAALKASRYHSHQAQLFTMYRLPKVLIVALSFKKTDPNAA